MICGAMENSRKSLKFCFNSPLGLIYDFLNEIATLFIIFTCFFFFFARLTISDGWRRRAATDQIRRWKLMCGSFLFHQLQTNITAVHYYSRHFVFTTIQLTVFLAFTNARLIDFCLTSIQYEVHREQQFHRPIGWNCGEPKCSKTQPTSNYLHKIY